MTAFIGRLKKSVPVNIRRTWVNKIVKQPLHTWIFDTAINNFGLNTVSQEQLLNDRQQYYPLQFGSEESVKVSEPDYNSDTLQAIADRIGTYNSKAPFVVEVADGELVGNAAVGFNRQGSLIVETVMPSFKTIPETLKTGLPASTFILKNFPIGSRLDAACSLVSCWSGNYYNWILYCLTRIEGLEYYQQQTGIKPTLIIDANPPRWKVESLKLLGYEPSDYIRWNHSRIKVDRLVVPSFRTRLQVPQLSSCQWLRQRIFSNIPNLETKKFASRVYISRPKKAGRSILNEDEVIKTLNAFGFVTYAPEKLSFPDQVRLVSQAEIVVSPHGAGLTNIVFGNNLKVIEIFDSYGTPAYFLLARVLGFRYSCLASKPSNKTGKHYDEQYKGIVVNIPKLQNLVEQMLELPAAQTQTAIANS